jgi:hypothetical protein
MRRTPALLLILLALVVPAFAVAAGAAVDDGTLTVKDGVGTVQIRANGVVLGRIARGSVQISDINPGDGGLPQITCEGKRDISDTTLDPNDVVVVCTGTDIRFRLIGGAFKLAVTGKGISLSVVGKGRVTLLGTGTDPGTFRFNSDLVETPLPDVRTVFDLNATTTVVS